jgi:hypothetical protein
LVIPQLEKEQAMGANQRKIQIYTPGKQYAGLIDVPNETLRTTDLFNSANLFWKNPHEKSFPDAIQMYEVTVSLDGIAAYQKHEKLQIRIPEVIFFCDAFTSISNQGEKTRAEGLKEKTEEKVRPVTIITRTKMNSFYQISGTFYGLFKSKTMQKFLPLSGAAVAEVIRRENQWVKKNIALPHNFLGVGIRYIEAATFT